MLYRKTFRVTFVPSDAPDWYIWALSLGVITVLTIVLLFFRYKLLRKISYRFGKVQGLNRRATKKFEATLFEMLCYTVPTIWGPICIRNELWGVRLPKNVHFSGVGDFNTQKFNFEQYLFFMTEFSIYMSLWISLYIEPKKKDFYVMQAHHFVTLLLMYLSVYMNYLGYGLLLLLLHNPSDTYLMWAKLFNYFGWLGGDRLLSAKNFLYLVFLWSWLYYRIWLLPFVGYWIFKSCWTDVMFDELGPLFKYTTAFLPWSLYVMHIYWLYLILRVVWRGMFQRGTFDDTRSETESDEDADSRVQDPIVRKRQPGLQSTLEAAEN